MPKQCIHVLMCFTGLFYLVNGDVIVDTESGKVAGKEVKSIVSGEKYYSFLGIPFAQPPVGALRFKAPVPHEGWNNILEAKKEKPSCAQFNIPSFDNRHGFCGKEDCLYLSIHTPRLPTGEDSDLPVIVFLYNENFRTSYNNSKDYGPDFFMNENVIIVTVNHRLGAFGFLAFGDELLPGNHGLRDIITALQWLQKNIKYFGGDAAKVTLMGHQGGAAIADILMHSNKATKLFNSVILQSGTAWSPVSFTKDPKAKAISLTENLEDKATDSKSIIERLSDVSAQDIATNELLCIHPDEAREYQIGVLPFAPVIEPEHPDAVITKYPEENTDPIDIPIMIGYNSREAIETSARFLHKPNYLTFADRDFIFLKPIRTGFHFQINDKVYFEAIDEIKDYYFDEGYVKISKPGEYLTYMNDVSTMYPIDYTLRAYLNVSRSAIYYYMFDFDGELNYRKKSILKEAITLDGTWGASRGDELCYLFVCNPIKKTYKRLLEEGDSDEIKVLQGMVRLYANFARTGNPTPPGDEFTWKPATKENKEILVISEELKMVNNLYEDKISFWDNFFAKYKAKAVDGIVKDNDKDELYKDTIELILKQGALSGLEEKSFLNEKTYYSFRGIPYAEPPVGPLRFKPPVPLQTWENTLIAHKNKPTCFQFSYRGRNNEQPGFSGSEDCLYLSVYTPNIKGSAPVVVFDYNDNFKTGFNGSDTYSPDFFIEEDVIVVTINHRLSIFGYLTTEDDSLPPNAGLKDFILGLRWIQDNIEDFGGDPSRVTLMGNRGGATLAHILLYSKKATGLFSGVIMQSGSATESVYFDNNLREKAFKIGELLNITTDNSEELVEKLQLVDASLLLSKEGNVLDENLMEAFQMTIHPFAPIVENDGPDAVFTSLPENAEIVNDVPIILGFNSREGLDLVSHYLMEPKLIDNNNNILFVFPNRVDFRFDRNSTVFKKAMEEVQNYYMKDGHLHYGNILEYSIYVEDLLQNYALHTSVEQLSLTLKSNVYYYLFDYRGLLNENSEYISRRLRFSMEHWGATITDELCYLHLCSRIKKTYEELKHLPSEQPEFKMLRKMVKMWTNFAKKRNPTPAAIDDKNILKNIKWDPIDKNGAYNYLHITKKLSMKEYLMEQRSNFWEKFLKKYRQMAKNGLVLSEEHIEL
ncbi:unnamed protein product [Leptosia nina]|uniref:Carboxylesterase type B domain-containing protein n=1 Tax=Leptosia nina TaxID=320188 RepID=A0AAV1JPY7_9NEOP